jgi:GNAT superfamily N-acetyltransferase
MNPSLRESPSYGYRPSHLLEQLRLRLALPDDDRSIGELVFRTFKEAYAKKQPPRIMTEERKNDLYNVALRRKKGVVYVMELGSKIIGTYSLIFPYALGSQAWISGASNLRCLAIAPEYQGRGLSIVMLKSSQVLARSWNAQSICLHVQRGAQEVAQIYSRFGYVRDPKGDTMISGYALEGYILEI